MDSRFLILTSVTFERPQWQGIAEMREQESQARLYSDPVSSRFVKKRDQLNRSLEESRLSINEWLAHQIMPTSLLAIARLEGLIARQRELHAELLMLEDDFMHYLLAARQSLPEQN
jgi:hypothetical protein